MALDDEPSKIPPMRRFFPRPTFLLVPSLSRSWRLHWFAAVLLLLCAAGPLAAAQKAPLAEIVPPRGIVQKGGQPQAQWKFLWDEARERARQKQYGRAAAIYEELLGQKGDLHEARWELAGIWLLLKKPERALLHLELLLEGAPNNLEYQEALAGALQQRGQYGRSAELYGKVLEASPGNDSALKGIAEALLAQGKWADALPYLEKWYREAPAAPGLRRLLADAYYELGLYEKARPFWAELAATGEDGELLRRAASIHARLGLASQAAGYWTRLQRLEPANKEARTFLAEYYEKEGQGEEALFYLLPRLEQEPDNPVLLKRVAQLHMGLKHFAQALPYFERYVALRPADKEVLRLVVDIHASLGNQAGTLASLERFLAAETQPELARLRQAAELYEAQGQVERALPLYERLLASAPDDPETLTHLARALLAVGDDQAALAYWDHLVKRQKLLTALERLHGQEPDNRKVMLKLAAMYLAKDALDESRQMFEKLSAAGEQGPDFLTARAGFYERIGHRAQALADYEAVLRFFPDRHEVRLRCIQLAGGLGYIETLQGHAEKLAAAERGGATVPPFRLAVANGYRDGGAWRKAAEIYQAALVATKESRERAMILLDVSRLYQLASRPYEAEQAARQALLEAPGRPAAAYFRLFELALLRNAPAEAEVWFVAHESLDSLGEKAGHRQESKPHLVQGKLLQARLWAAQGSYKDAVRAVRDLLADLPQPDGERTLRGYAHRDLLLLQGRILLEAEKFAAVQTLLEEVREEDQQDLEVAVQLLAALVGQGDEAGAAALSSQVVPVSRVDAGRLLELLQLCREYGQAAALLEVAAAGREVLTGSLAAQRLLADAWVASGQPERALPLLAELGNRFPEESDLLFRRSEVLFHTGQPEAASQLLALLPAVCQHEPEVLLLRSRMAWIMGERKAGLETLANVLSPPVEEELAKAAATQGLVLPAPEPPDFWARLTGHGDVSMPIAALVMDPQYLAGESSRQEALHRLAVPLYAKYRWQQQLQDELRAKQAVVHHEYFAAVKGYEKLLRQYPVDGSVQYDLAGVYSRLDMPAEEASLYAALQAGGEEYPGFAEAVRRNSLNRRPRSTASYGVRREEGREGYKDLRKEWLTMDHRQTLGLQQEFAATLTRADYQSTDSADTIKASRAEASYSRKLFSGLALDAGGGAVALEKGYGDTLLAHLSVAGDWGDRLWSSLSFRRDVVEDTVASLTRAIVQELVKAELAVDLFPRLQVGAGYGYRGFTDNNWTQGYDVRVSYILLTDPTFLKLSYTYDFKDSLEGQQPGLPLVDGYGLDDHPYWAPRSYWQKRFNVFFKHRLGDDPFQREAPRYYTAEYTLAYDSRGYALQSWKGSFFVEWTPHFLAEAAVGATTSQEYRSRDLLLSLVYRW